MVVKAGCMCVCLLFAEGFYKEDSIVQSFGVSKELFSSERNILLYNDTLN